MAQIARSVEVNAPVDTIHEEWQRFEALPRCAAHSLTANVKWRAEVLTLEPIPEGTRITLKIEYDASAGDGGLPCRLEGTLQSFRSFFELRQGRASMARPS